MVVAQVMGIEKQETFLPFRKIMEDGCWVFVPTKGHLNTLQKLVQVLQVRVWHVMLT